MSKKIIKPKKRCEEIVNFLIKSEPTVFKELNTKRLAKMYCVNRSYLSRTFKKYQEENLNEYIKRLRILKSALLLIETRHLKIGDIAEYFGWERSDCFIKAFKKFFGISPGKFRNLMQS